MPISAGGRLYSSAQSHLKNATRDIVLSSNGVLDDANIERSTAGVTGMPPLSPSGGIGRLGLPSVERWLVLRAVALDDVDDAMCPRPGVTVDDEDDIQTVVVSIACSCLEAPEMFDVGKLPTTTIYHHFPNA